MLTERLEFAPERDAEVFSAVPAAPAVFLLRGDGQAEPYVSKTANLRRRLQRLLGPVEERTKKLNLRDRVRSIEYSATGSDFESGFLLYSVLRAAFPKTYSNRMRFRFAPFVKLASGERISACVHHYSAGTVQRAVALLRAVCLARGG